MPAPLAPEFELLLRVNLYDPGDIAHNLKLHLWPESSEVNSKSRKQPATSSSESRPASRSTLRGEIVRKNGELMRPQQLPEHPYYDGD